MAGNAQISVFLQFTPTTPFSCTGGKNVCDTVCDTSPVSVDAFESTKVIEEKMSHTIISATPAHVFSLDEDF